MQKPIVVRLQECHKKTPCAAVIEVILRKYHESPNNVRAAFFFYFFSVIKGCDGLQTLPALGMYSELITGVAESHQGGLKSIIIAFNYNKSMFSHAGAQAEVKVAEVHYTRPTLWHYEKLKKRHI